MERKLASVRVIKDLLPIDGADFIEIAKIDGWQCVVKKGEFRIGDLCVYFEVDSFLPIEDRYEFLRKSSYKKMGDKEGFRLRTIKLKGQLSQGLALPLSGFDFHISTPLSIGTDLTEILGVEKYDPPLPANLSGLVKRYFPSFIKKTDQERVQNIANELIDGIWLMTEKLDGTSFTCYKFNGEFGVCSRNLELVETDDNTYWQVARALNLEGVVADGFAIQGEIIGPGIQGNKYGLGKPQLYVFHVFDINKQQYLDIEEVVSWSATNELLHVPILGEVDLTGKNVDDVLLIADGESKLNEVDREGIVFYKHPFSFKAVSNNWLLKNK